MSDRPTAVNGKRSQAWGTMSPCPDCGACLCFACHPHGPCCDDHDERRGQADAAGATLPAEAYGLAGWSYQPDNGLGVAGVPFHAR